MGAKALQVNTLFPAIALCVAAAATNAGETAARDGGLTGTVWTLATLSGAAPPAGFRPTLEFRPGGKVRGFDGCNRFHGGYRVQGAALAFAPNRAATRMACADAVTVLAERFGAALDRTTGFARDGRRLELHDAGGTSMMAFEAQAAPLTGTTWMVTSYNNGRHAVVSVMPGATVDAYFGDDGRVAGSAGCNRYSAAFESGAGTLRVGPVRSTRRRCAQPDGVMQQEADFFAALRSSARYRIEGARATLRTEAGAVALTLAKTEPDSDATGAGKIAFDLARLNVDGLQGAADGLRALHYEFCLPDRADTLAAVRGIDPSVEIQRSAPGRARCRPGELLCLGNTHQPGFRQVLQRLAALPAIREIHESFFE